MEKRCSKCRKVKSLDLFYRNKNTFDGRMSECIDCKKVREKKLLLNQEFTRKRRLRLNKFKRTDKGRESNKRYYQSVKLRNPEKLKARRQVEYAKTMGKLKQENCEVCGSPDSNAHHDNYSKPLDVRWLCTIHHNKLHGIERTY